MKNKFNLGDIVDAPRFGIFKGEIRSIRLYNKESIQYDIQSSRKTYTTPIEETELRLYEEEEEEQPLLKLGMVYRTKMNLATHLVCREEAAPNMFSDELTIIWQSLGDYQQNREPLWKREE